MKRSGPLKRSVLEHNTELARGGVPLPRHRRATRRTRPETMSEATARRLVYGRSGGLCEKCGHAPASNWHHRKDRSLGGLWLPTNGLHLCGSGTTGCHGQVTTQVESALRHGWSTRSWQDPAIVPVKLAWHGWVLLDDAGDFQPVLGGDL